MLPRIFTRAAFFLCFLVSAISAYGSPRRYPSEVHIRNRRHASCPSCRQDCPGALSAPWYGENIYERLPRREYRSLESEGYGGWSKNQPLQNNPQILSYPYVQQYRSTRSRGGLPTGINAATSGSAYKRENPFNLRDSRGAIDSYVAPTPATTSLAINKPVNLIESRRFANPRIHENHQRTPYNPNFYEFINRQTISRERQDYPKPKESPVFPYENDVRLKNFNDPRKKFFPAYPTFQRSEMSYNQEMPEENRQSDRPNDPQETTRYFSQAAKKEPEFQEDLEFNGRRTQEKMIGRDRWENMNGHTVDAIGEFSPRPEILPQYTKHRESITRSGTIPSVETQEDLPLRPQYRRNRSFDPQEYRASDIHVHVPKIKYNPYNLSPDLNVLRMMQNIERQASRYNQRNRWHEEDSMESDKRDYISKEEKEKEEEDREKKMFVERSEKIRLTEKPRVRTMEINEFDDETHQDLQADLEPIESKDSKDKNDRDKENRTTATAENEKSIEESMIEGSTANEQTPYDLDLDLIEDVENPSVESTEPTTVDRFIETSTVSE